MSNLENLSEKRQAAVAEAAAGCWPGTEEMIGALVHESRHKGAWRPTRAAVLLHTANAADQLHMTAEQFGVWKRQARYLAKIKGRTERPVDDLGMAARRFSELSAPLRHKTKGLMISRGEALACAHYLAGHDKPCDAAGLAEWFRPRFGSYTHIAPVLDMGNAAFAARISGYQIDDGVRKEVVPEGWFIRALDWIWRYGTVNPYAQRPPIEFWPGQDV